METFSALFELASVSLACRDQDTLLKTFVARVGATLGARAVFVWTNGSSSKGAEGLTCRMRWNEPGERFAPHSEAVSEGLLADVYESAETRRVSSKEITADDFEHLDELSRARVKSAIVVSLPGAQRAEGVVEVLNKRAGEFTAEDAHFLEEASRLAGSALTNLEAIEGERQAQLFTSNASPRSTIWAAPSPPPSNSASCFPLSPVKFATSWVLAPAACGSPTLARRISISRKRSATTPPWKTMLACRSPKVCSAALPSPRVQN